MQYSFNFHSSCNMCKAGLESQKILGRRLSQSQGKKPGEKIGLTTTVMKCKSCSLIYSNPQPIPHNITDHYGVTPENYWKKEYFQIDPNYFKPQLETLIKLIPVNSNSKSLDIGAGLGKAMISLSEFGFDTYGFEPSEQFRERAISKMNISPEKLKFGMIEEVEYPEEFFDFITFGAVLEHLYDPSESIQKALKWLKPGGIIHIEVPSSDWLINKLINLYYKFTFSGFVGNLSPMHEPYHLYEFGADSFRKHSTENNYEIAFMEYFVCSTYLPPIFDRILKPIMKKTNTGLQLSIWLRKHSYSE